MYKQLSREQKIRNLSGNSKKAKARKPLLGKTTSIPPPSVAGEAQQHEARRVSMATRAEVIDERRERLPGNHAVRPDVMQEALRLLVSEDWSPNRYRVAVAQRHDRLP